MLYSWKWSNLSTTHYTITSSKAMLFAPEKNNKYFFNLESRKMSNSCIHKLFDKGGKLITSPKLILWELYDFYTELHSNYASPNHNNASDAFLNHCRLPTLNEDAEPVCEGVYTEAECFKALKMIKNWKSPGKDGLKVFWPTLRHLVGDSLNSSFEKGDLANSKKQGIIKLMEKKT